MLNNLMLLLLSLLICTSTSDVINKSELNKYKYETVRQIINNYNIEAESTNTYWRTQGLATVYDKVASAQITKTAKNIILFLGDGMSVPTLAAARIYMGQLNGTAGENAKLSFEKFPYTGFSKTYCVNKQVADSACSATAYLGGVKANMGTLGVNAVVQRSNCTLVNEPNNRVHTVLNWAQDAGKATGLVTTTRITHASPAGNYAFTAERDFESDYDISISSDVAASTCTDIAKQLVRGEPGKNIKVLLGGGRVKFLPKNTADYESGTGERVDGVNLIDEWQQQKTNLSSKPAFVWNRDQLLGVNVTDTDYLLGLFEPDHMKYHTEANATTEPTLEEMTRVAIQMLQKEDKGFYLFVEGGRIDMAHHHNWALRAFDETVEFQKAVQAAVEMTDIQDTLIVVTSDHAHTMSFSGYPVRGDDILSADQMSTVDKLPYTTISYANGPSASVNTSRRNPNTTDITGDLYQYPSLVNLNSETHGGDDVGVFARGPYAHLFTGVYEQNVIPLTMSYAGDIGPASRTKSSSSKIVSFGLTTLIAVLFVEILT